MVEDQPARREALADRIAGIVLSDGLSALALRGLAARLNSSGRMLLYYFGSKDALVRCAVDRIATRLAVLLAEQDAAPLATPGAVLAAIVARAQQPDVAPFMLVWTEIIARAARGEAPYDSIADATITGWIAWIEGRLLPAYRGRGMAETMLCFMEGATLLELARPGTTEAARALLPGMLPG